MKSSYELAMERFGDDDDAKPLSDEQKAEIAEIDLNPVLVHPEGQGLSVVDVLIVKQAGD